MIIKLFLLYFKPQRLHVSNVAEKGKIVEAMALIKGICWVLGKKASLIERVELWLTYVLYACLDTTRTRHAI